MLTYSIPYNNILGTTYSNSSMLVSPILSLTSSTSMSSNFNLGSSISKWNLSDDMDKLIKYIEYLEKLLKIEKQYNFEDFKSMEMDDITNVLKYIDRNNKLVYILSDEYDKISNK